MEIIVTYGRAVHFWGPRTGFPRAGIIGFEKGPSARLEVVRPENTTGAIFTENWEGDCVPSPIQKLTLLKSPVPPLTRLTRVDPGVWDMEK